MARAMRSARCAVRNRNVNRSYHCLPLSIATTLSRLLWGCRRVESLVAQPEGLSEVMSRIVR